MQYGFRSFVLQHPYMTLFLFFVLLFSLGTIGIEITRIDVRFALMTEELSRYPVGVFPTVNGVAYADYPVTCQLLSWVTTLGGHWVNQWSLALPTMLFGAGLIALTAKLGDSVRPGLGIIAAAFSLLTLEYLRVFLCFSIDVPVAFITMAAIFLLQKPWNRWQPALLLILLLAALAVRGPLGLILTGAAVTGYLAGCRRWRELMIFWGTGAVAVLIGVPAAVALIYWQGGRELLDVFWQWQVSSRMGNDDLFYYFTSGIASFAPVVPLALVFFCVCRRKPEGQVAGWLGWALLPLLLLSIPACKHLRYMTLTIPAFSLVAAWCFLTLPEKASRWIRPLDRLSWLCLPVAVIAILGLAVAGIILAGMRAPMLQWGTGLVLVLAAGRLLRGQKLLCCAVLFSIVATLGFFPFGGMLEDSRTFVSAVEKERTGRIYLFCLGPDHDDLKYVLNTAPERRKDIIYLFIKPRSTETQLGKMYPALIAADTIPLIQESDRLILLEQNLPKLREMAGRVNLDVVVFRRGSLGHRDCVSAGLVPRSAVGVME